MMKVRQISLLLLLFVVLTSLLIGGCQPVEQTADTLIPDPGALSQEALTLFGVDPATVDPAISRDITSHTYVMQIFSGLVALDEELKVVPDIARGWEVSEDGRTYTFYLRSDVRFQDGRYVEAGDFKYSWERACAPETGSQTAADYLGDIVGTGEVLAGKEKEISGVEVTDDHTLQVTIDFPKAYFLAKLTYPTAFVVDRANAESGGDWWRKPNGTGPFKLGDWKKGELLVLERSELYYGELAGVERVIFRLWSGVPMSMYEGGEIDVAHVGLANIEKVLDPTNPLHRELEKAPELSLHYVGFDTTGPPFDDVNIRRAFCRAVDKDKIINLSLKGIVKRADGVLPPGMPGYNEHLRGLDYDPVLARELVATSGYGSVSGLPPITLTTSGYGGVPNYLAAVIDMWRRNLGVEVVIRQLEPEAYFYHIKEEKDAMFDAGWVADYPDPQSFLDILFRTGSNGNDSEFSNPEADILLERAAKERDDAIRMGIYQEIEQMLVDDAACLPLWFGENYILVKPYVENYALSPLGIPALGKVHVEPHGQKVQ